LGEVAANGKICVVKMPYSGGTLIAAAGIGDSLFAFSGRPQ
jgi:hypothetical protein